MFGVSTQTRKDDWIPCLWSLHKREMEIDFQV